MSGPEARPRVRVVLEGEVTSDYYGGLDTDFIIGCGRGQNVITPDAEHVVSVEVLRPPVKVGDVIETAEQLDALPIGAAVKPSGRYIAERNYSGWYFTGVQTNYAATDVDIPATVIYLPDGAA